MENFNKCDQEIETTRKIKTASLDQIIKSNQKIGINTPLFWYAKSLEKALLKNSITPWRIKHGFFDKYGSCIVFVNDGSIMSIQECVAENIEVHAFDSVDFEGYLNEAEIQDLEVMFDNRFKKKAKEEQKLQQKREQEFKMQEFKRHIKNHFASKDNDHTK